MTTSHRYGAINEASVGSWLSIVFSLLCALLPTVSSAESHVTSRTYFGMHIHHAGKDTPWPRIGFGSWRLWDAYVSWADLEPSRGKWDFRRLDEYLRMAHQQGVSLLLPLGLSPQWASARPQEKAAYGLGRAAEPREMSDWKTYVRTIARRYKGSIKDFEIWNEPNSRDFFTGEIDTLVQLTCEAYRILKEESPHNIVVSPAYTGGQHVQLLAKFLAKGGRHCIDVVAYHLYVTPAYPEAIRPLVAQIKKAMLENGVGHLPLWNTESGWWMANADGTPEPGVAPPYWRRIEGAVGAAIVARALILAKASGVERFYWYAWDNKALGLMEPGTKAPKAGAYAFQRMVDWLQDKSTPICEEKRGQWICELMDTNGALFVIVWSVEEMVGSYMVPDSYRIVNLDHATPNPMTMLSVDQARSVTTSTTPMLIALRKR